MLAIVLLALEWSVAAQVAANVGVLSEHAARQLVEVLLAQVALDVHLFAEKSEAADDRAAILVTLIATRSDPRLEARW